MFQQLRVCVELPSKKVDPSSKNFKGFSQKASDVIFSTSCKCKTFEVVTNLCPVFSSGCIVTHCVFFSRIHICVV